MAILKFINGKNKKKAGLIRAIDFIADKEKKETFNINKEDAESLFINDLLVYNKGDRAINYITKDDKTELSLITGINCSPVSAFERLG